MQIGSYQLELIARTKKYLQYTLNKKISAHSSGVCYFCSPGLSPGYAKLQLWHKGFKSIFIIIKTLFKDFVSISTLYNYQLVKNYKIKNKYNKIIVSWAKETDFLPDGTYFDKYFNTNSRELKNSLWFLIYEGKILPLKIDDNLLIFAKSQKKLKYNFFYLFKRIIEIVIDSKFLPNKIFHEISWFTEFSHIVCKNVKKFINDDTEVIIMPYEAQPFQNTIFKKSKEINNKIKTIGYVHSFPVGLPTNFIHREGAPDKLIVNGQDQYDCFKNHLNWNSNHMKILPSARYTKKNVKNMSGYIYLPITLNSINKITKSLEKFILLNDAQSIPKLIIKNHPYTKNSRKHIIATKKINSIIAKYDNLFSKKGSNKKMSIFIGSTASVIEALENGIEVIHICEDPVFQSYDNILWPSIKVKKISNNIFKYQLLKKGNLIRFGEDNQLFSQSYLN